MLMVWCIGEYTLEYAKYSGMVNFQLKAAYFLTDLKEKMHTSMGPAPLALAPAPAQTGQTAADEEEAEQATQHQEQRELPRFEEICPQHLLQQNLQ